MAKMKFNRNVNINKVVGKLAYTLIALWVGGTILTVLGNVMNGTESPFYQGLSLIGWTVTDGQITSTSSANTGVLMIVGLVGIASIVLEFVQFKM
jgi:hypothetical protein